MGRTSTIVAFAAGSLVPWLIFRHGFANYDTFYALLWGADLADGRLPDYEAPIAPTPHPLATFAGLLLAPLGDRAEAAVVGLAFLALGGLGAVVYRLGAAWFGPAAGALAVVVLLTREPLLSFGVRGYVDVPYLALVLGALLVETRRPHAGAPVLALLALAGLLRPEAWLFSAAYVAWLWHGGRRRDEFVRLAGLAAAAPLCWALSDLLVTGDALHSLTGTRETAETLGRQTGLDAVPTIVPRRLGEILREPVLVAAAGGGLLALYWMRERARAGIAAGLLALAAFLLLAAAGLPIIGRYLLLLAALLSIFAGAGALGWLALERGDPRRARWAVFGALCIALLVAFVPAQTRRIDRLRDAIARQERIRDDLHDLARSGAFERSCAPVAVPNHRPVPLLALWLDRRPREIVSAQLRQPRSGYYLDPASARVARDFTLDRNDPRPLVASVPPGFSLVASNRSWRLYERC